MDNQNLGKLEISNGVLADIVGYAALECYGIVGVANANAIDSFMRVLPISRIRRGINIKIDEGTVHVDIFVIVEYGTNISTVSENLRERILFVLKEYAGIDDVVVNVHVKDVNVSDNRISK